MIVDIVPTKALLVDCKKVTTSSVGELVKSYYRGLKGDPLSFNNS
jgi:hypothetical protein